MAILAIAVTKGKATVDVDTDKIPQDVYEYALELGLKTLVNRGASKITKETYPDADELKAAAMAKAAEQVTAIMEGKVRKTGAPKKAGVTGAVNTEAMRLAKAVVKDEMKRLGIKISHVPSSEITKAAKELVASDPSYIEQAKANLEERGKVKVGIDLKALIKESPELVKKAEERKAKSKAGTISAKQAGMVSKRQKGQPQATAH